MVARDLFEQLTMVFQYLSFLDAKTVFMVGDIRCFLVRWKRERM